MRFSSLENANTDATSRYTPSCDDDLASIGCDSESLPSENELIDEDIFENIVFEHNQSEFNMGELYGFLEE